MTLLIQMEESAAKDKDNGFQIDLILLDSLHPLEG